MIWLQNRHGKYAEYPAESRPVAQISPKSYLGAALKNAGRSKDSGPPSGSSSSLEPS